MKYENGQFGERHYCDRGFRVRSAANVALTYKERRRAVACVNALDGLDPAAVPKIAAWWGLQQYMSNWQPHPELAKLLNQPIGADDE